MPVSRKRKSKPARSRPRSAPRDRRTPGVIVMEELATLDPGVDPLSAEHVLSEVFGLVYGSEELDKQETVDALALTLLEEAESTDGPGSRELLALLAALGPELVRDRAAAMLDLARALPLDEGAPPVTEPAWMAQLGTERCTGAWSTSDAYGDVTQYVATFGYAAAGEPEHVLIWLVHNNMGPIASDCLVGRDAVGVLAELRAFSAAAENSEEVTLGELDPADLQAHVLQAMAVETTTEGPPVYDTYSANRAIAFARLAALPSTTELPDPVTMSEDERDDLIDEFLASPFAGRIADPENPLWRTLDDEDREYLVGDGLGSDGEIDHLLTTTAGHVLDYTLERFPGDAVRVTPQTMELFLLAWAPYRAFITADEARWLPELLKTWVRFAHERRPRGPLGPILEAVDACIPAFRAAMASDEAAASRLVLASAFLDDLGSAP